MRDPVGVDYQCPYITSECVKRSHRVAGAYPVCTVFAGQKNKKPIAVCPKRFYETTLVNDVITYAWPFTPPINPRVAYEIRMGDCGSIDFVVADVDEDNNIIRNFVSVELQAVDITGSVEPYYNAIINNQATAKANSFGLNWANVRKRYVTQLIHKGFFHHHWNTRIVSIIQEPLLDRIREHSPFDEISLDQNPNIVFLIYDYVLNHENDPATYSLLFKRAVGTSHSSLMMSALYKLPPPKQEFCSKILERLY